MRQKILLLPGTLCDTILFRHQIAPLTEKGECEVIDLSLSPSLPEMAAEILANTGDRSISVIGLSFGGIVAFELWRQAPEKIDKLILLNTTHRLPTEKTQQNMAKFVAMTHQGKFEAVTTDFLTDAMLHPNHASDRALRDDILTMAKNVGKAGFLNQVKAQLGRCDSTPDLPGIRCPTLLIVGKQDNVCPVSLHEEMHRIIPHSTLKVIDNCGHLSTLEQPEWVNRHIMSWWNDLNR